MYIKSATSHIPGQRGNIFGKLIPTEQILQRMCNSESPRFSPSFVKTVLGIESVAATHSTIDAMSRRLDWARNTDLYRALSATVEQAVIEAGGPRRLVAHIHIAGQMEPVIEHELGAIRQELKLELQLGHTVLLQQGCAGIITALHLAEKIMGENEDLLVTAENNSILQVPSRLRPSADIHNVDDWLFATIFGDAVGAMIVSKTPTEGSLKVEVHSGGFATREWRVKEHFTDDGQPFMRMRARAVSETYLANVGRLARVGIEKFGGPQNLDYLLLHESNPNMLRQVCSELDVPEDKYFVTCDKVGTLAAVSSFSLLSQARDRLREKGVANANLALVVLGESGSGIETGLLTLTTNGRSKGSR